MPNSAEEKRQALERGSQNLNNPTNPHNGWRRVNKLGALLLDEGESTATIIITQEPESKSKPVA